MSATESATFDSPGRGLVATMEHGDRIIAGTAALLAEHDITAPASAGSGKNAARADPSVRGPLGEA